MSQQPPRPGQPQRWPQQPYGPPGRTEARRDRTHLAPPQRPLAPTGLLGRGGPIADRRMGLAGEAGDQRRRLA